MNTTHITQPDKDDPIERISWSHIIRHYYELARPYRSMGILATVTFIVAILIERSVMPLVLQNVIDSVTTDKTVFPWVMIGIFVGSAIIYRAAYRVADLATATFESRVLVILKSFAFTEILKKSIHMFHTTSHGTLLTKINRYTSAFETMFDILAWELSWVTIQVLVAIVVFIYKVPIFGIILAIWSVVFVYIAIRLRARRDPLEEAENEADSAVTGEIADVLSNINAIMAFGTTAREAHRTNGAIESHQKKNLKLWYYSNYERLVQSFMMVILEVPVIILSLRMYQSGALTIGEMILVHTYVYMVQSSLWGVGRTVQRFSKAKNDAAAMIAIMENNNNEYLAGEEVVAGSTLSGSVVYDAVTYTYPEKEHPALTELSLNIPQGQKVGIVGSTGAGKSTMIQLLLGLVRPDTGAISIGGIETTTVAPALLRQSIAYVPQETALLHRTIRENIAYLRPDATEEEIIAAAIAAKAHDFISELPEGYNAKVGERGVKLSGGQRQRIALARAILSHAQIVVLDEATSALDVKTEHLIQEVLDTAFVGRTLIVIAHRLSTVSHLDTILVLDHGRIAESGTHRELLSKNGIYSDLVQHQLSSSSVLE